MFRKKRILQNPIVVDLGAREVKVLTYSEDPETRNVVVHGLGSSRISPGKVLHGCLSEPYEVITAIENAYIEAKAPHQNQDSLTILTGVSGIMMDVVCSEIDHRREHPHKKIRPKEWTATLDRIRCRIDEEEYRSSKHHNAPMGLAQSSIEHLFMDGVPIKEIVSNTGQQMTFQLFNTYVPEQHLESLRRVSEELNIPIQGAFHTMYGVSRLILDNHQNPHLSMILIDIGEDHTDVAIVLEGSLKEVQSFSIGGSTFTQRIADTFEISPEEAESIKREYSLAQLPRNISAKITDVLTDDIKLWLQGVECSLEKVASDMRLPERMIVFGGGASLIGIKEGLEFGNWYKNLSESYKPYVSVFYPRSLPHVVDETDALNDPKYIPLLGILHVGSRMNRESTFGFNNQ